MQHPKKYLGDGLYLSHDGFQYWLTTDTDEVALCDYVLQAFLKEIHQENTMLLATIIDITPVQADGH